MRTCPELEEKAAENEPRGASAPREERAGTPRSEEQEGLAQQRALGAAGRCGPPPPVPFRGWVCVNAECGSVPGTTPGLGAPQWAGRARPCSDGACGCFTQSRTRSSPGTFGLALLSTVHHDSLEGGVTVRGSDGGRMLRALLTPMRRSSAGPRGSAFVGA